MAYCRLYICHLRTAGGNAFLPLKGSNSNKLHAHRAYWREIAKQDLPLAERLKHFIWVVLDAVLGYRVAFTQRPYEYGPQTAPQRRRTLYRQKSKAC